MNLLLAFLLSTSVLASTTSAVERKPYTPTLTIAQSPVGLPIVRRLWDFGDPSSGKLNTSTEAEPSHIYRHAKTYTIRLTVWDSAGNQGTKTQNLTVVKK
jgi:hypothetical protein